MTVLYIVIAVLIILGLVIWASYNSLVRLKVRVDEAWSDITVQLKRRYDLIPNLVETVKGYATHEKTVFEDVTKARANAMNAQGVAETAKTNNQFEQTLKSLFAVAENYPQLRATENFQQLQSQLTDTEDKIMAARRFYNSGVRDLNTKIHVFPTNVFAKRLGFKEREFFQDEDASENLQKPVDVKF
ncbi:MAG TPA: LemA family protein [Candidatus Saccharimonadales bacterium]|nr:LemA family protein [Candidatus Saccharimonadales bacterium]